MISTSKRIIPNKHLILIGKYVDITTPREEYIPANKISIIACNWSEFEKTMIDKYIRLNLGKK